MALSLRTLVALKRRHREVLGRLRAIDGRPSALDFERLTALQDLAQVESEELQQTRQELVAAQEQWRLLQGGLDQLAPTRELPAGVVGDLESLTTSHAMLLLPHMGFTKVYHLNQEDLLNVDILNRSPAMSCDRLYIQFGTFWLRIYSLGCDIHWQLMLYALFLVCDMSCCFVIRNWFILWDWYKLYGSGCHNGFWFSGLCWCEPVSIKAMTPVFVFVFIAQVGGL